MTDDDMKPYKDIAILQREIAYLSQAIINRDKEIAKLKEKITLLEKDIKLYKGFVV